MLNFKMWCRCVIFLHFAFLNCAYSTILSTGSTHDSTTPLHSHTTKPSEVIRARSLTVTPPGMPFNITFKNTSSTRNSDIASSFIKPMDCAELLQIGHRKNGVYTIWPRNKLMDGRQLDVYCDMETDKGGWIVLQRRGNYLRPKDYFYKDWESYKIGFGDIERDFWLGNDNIFTLTNQRLYSARFDLIDVDGLHLYALYDTFFIENEESKYKLTIKDYSGTANDSMILWHNGQHFSTKGQDNDNNKNSSCAQTYKGGWWYNACHASNLNGLYLRGKHKSFADGVVWSKWKGHHESMDSTEIKIRPKNFRKTLI